MTDINTKADSIQRFHTGASADNQEQLDKALSLGGFCSSTRVDGMIHNVDNPMEGLSIIYVSPNNGYGDGLLTAESETALSWTAPESLVSDPTECPVGESTMIMDYIDPSKYIIVYNNSATLEGTSTVSLDFAKNSVIAMDDTSSTESTYGSIKYKAIMVKNCSDYLIHNLYIKIGVIGTPQVSNKSSLKANAAGKIATNGSFSGWQDSGFCRIEDKDGNLKEIVYYANRTNKQLTVPVTGRAMLGTSITKGSSTDLIYCVPGIRIAIEEPIDDQIQTIQDDTTEPSGVLWSTAISNETGFYYPTVVPNEKHGLWIERTIAEKSSANPNNMTPIHYTFEAP